VLETLLPESEAIAGICGCNMSVDVLVDMYRSNKSRCRDLLVRITGSDLPLKVSLLVVKVLKLEVQAIDFLTRLGCLSLCLAGLEAGISVQSFQMGHSGEKEPLLLEYLILRLVRCRSVAVCLFAKVNKGTGLIACLVGNLQDSAEPRVCHNFIDGHDFARVRYR
jgi:hypothetical protein